MVVEERDGVQIWNENGMRFYPVISPKSRNCGVIFCTDEAFPGSKNTVRVDREGLRLVLLVLGGLYDRISDR